METVSPKITKKAAEETGKALNQDKEYSWIVKTEKIPSGESLLKLFGKLLFDTAELTVYH